jgi:hypothetical protein
MASDPNQGRGVEKRMNTHTYLIANVITYLFLFAIWKNSNWHNLLIRVAFGGMLIATVYLLVRP